MAACITRHAGVGSRNVICHCILVCLLYFYLPWACYYASVNINYLCIAIMNMMLLYLAVVLLKALQGPMLLIFMILKDPTLCFVENEAITGWSVKASSRLHQAFRPKTHKAYTTMFKTFVAFCIFTKVCLENADVKAILSFLECLVANAVSSCMLANYVSAIKANFILYDLPFQVLGHPKVKYFIKAVKINRPPALKSHNIISISMLTDLALACGPFPYGQVYKASLLLGFFAFLRLSNLAPHSVAAFDQTRHFTGQDVFFTRKHLKLITKWSKTMQTRDKIQCITVPKLKNKIICPFRAVRALQTLYTFASSTSLLQIPSHQGLIPLTDSKMCKVLKSINLSLGLEPSYFTFHDL